MIMATAYPSQSTTLCRRTPTNGSSTATYAASPMTLAMFDAAYSRCTCSGSEEARASQTCSSGEVAERIANGSPIAAMTAAVTQATGGQPGLGVSHNAWTANGHRAMETATSVAWMATPFRTSAVRTSSTL